LHQRKAIVPILNIKALHAAVLPGKHSLTGQVANAVGLGGVAEAWYEGRTLFDAFQHPKVTQNASAPEEYEEEDEAQDLSVPGARCPQALAGKGYAQALAGQGGGSEAAWRRENQENATNSNRVAMLGEAQSAVGGSVAAHAPENSLDDLQQREYWAVGSCMEVFSSSASKWYIAQVTDVGEKGIAKAQMVTVQFVGDNGQILQKTMPRRDSQLATFGRNTRLMPPNFQKVASESRPGEFSYQDSESRAKYQTKELAWQQYFAAIFKCGHAQQLLSSTA